MLNSCRIWGDVGSILGSKWGKVFVELVQTSCEIIMEFAHLGNTFHNYAPFAPKLRSCHVSPSFRSHCHPNSLVHTTHRVRKALRQPESRWRRVALSQQSGLSTLVKYCPVVSLQGFWYLPLHASHIKCDLVKRTGSASSLRLSSSRIALRIASPNASSPGWGKWHASRGMLIHSFCGGVGPRAPLWTS